MRITIPVTNYSGVDGSSLSDVRCEQFVKLYDLALKFGNQAITYKMLQEKAIEEHIFGDTKADSAIRTIFPLFSKLGFAQIWNNIPANEVFTVKGYRLVQLTNALTLAKSANNQTLINELQVIKALMIQDGLVYWRSQTTNLKTHNIWLATTLAKRLSVFDWREFQYAINPWHQSLNIDNIVAEILQNRENNIEYEILKSDGKPLPDTSFTYIRALLNEAQILKDENGLKSRITEFGSNIIDKLI